MGGIYAYTGQANTCHFTFITDSVNNNNNKLRLYMGLTTGHSRGNAASIAVLKFVTLQEACMLLSHLLGDLEHGTMSGDYVIRHV